MLEHGKRLAAIEDAQRSIEKELKALLSECDNDEKIRELGSAMQGSSGDAQPALEDTTIAILKDDDNECFMDAFSQVVSTQEDEEVSDEEE